MLRFCNVGYVHGIGVEGVVRRVSIASKSMFKIPIEYPEGNSNFLNPAAQGR